MEYKIGKKSVAGKTSLVDAVDKKLNKIPMTMLTPKIETSDVEMLDQIIKVKGKELNRTDIIRTLIKEYIKQFKAKKNAEA